jgi:hypothetical protein
MAPRKTNKNIKPTLGSGKGRGLSSGSNFSKGLSYHLSQFEIDEQRYRDQANENRFQPSDMIPIHWDPNTTYYHAADESSRVESFRYQATDGLPGAIGYSGTLFVRFIKGSTPWKYLNVPEHIYQAFASAQSKGRYINSVLNNFPNSRASAGEEGKFFIQSQI